MIPQGGPHGRQVRVVQGQGQEALLRLKAGNGETILASQGYRSKAGCLNGIESVRTNSTRSGAVEERKSKNGQHYFVLKAGNGQIVGTSERYKSTSACSNGCKSVAKNAPKAKLAEV